VNRLVTCGLGRNQSIVARGLSRVSSFINEDVVEVAEALRYRLRGSAGNRRRVERRGGVTVQATMVEVNGRPRSAAGRTTGDSDGPLRRVIVERLGSTRRAVKVLIERLR